METTINQRVKRMLKYYNLTENSVADRLNISQTTLNSALNSKKDNLNSKIIAGIRKIFPDVDIDWLLTGEGEMLKSETSVEETKPLISYSDGVPYYDEFFECGFDELTPSQVRNPDFLVRMPGYDKATLWCNASGASMEPEISNGDLIALQAIPDFSYLPFGDIYGIITTNGMRTIKRLGKSTEPGCYRLIPTNKEYDEQDIPVRLIAAVYRVMGALKTF